MKKGMIGHLGGGIYLTSTTALEGAGIHVPDIMVELDGLPPLNLGKPGSGKAAA
jgi:hypothetical protein